ncbi:MAG: putative phage abortive infection protein, partial [Variovorax sp.]
ADAQYARQSFEPLFFKLLELLREQAGPSLVLDGSRFTNDGSFLGGLSAFRSQAVIIDKRVALSVDIPGGWLQRQLVEFETFYVGNERHLGPYLRTLYRCLRLIRFSSLTESEKAEYANILRGLLNRDEVFLLMLNCCSPHGLRTKPYIEHFGMLKHAVSPPSELDAKIAREAFVITATLSYRGRCNYWASNPRPVFHED